MAEIEIIEKDLSYAMMQAAFDVHNTLVPGSPESIYDEAMARELTARRIKIERQKKITVKYRNQPVGEFILDNIVEERVILEYKAVSEIARVHEQQALSYLKATGLQLAIVINFGATRVQSSRVINITKTVLPARLYHPQIKTGN